MTRVSLYAAGCAAFGAIARFAPEATGRSLADDGGAAPDGQAFLRRMGGRDIGIGAGLLTAASVTSLGPASRPRPLTPLTVRHPRQRG